ncbi:UNVERIFIED_CONTAM: Phosphoglycolate phosphatase 1A, chloroplastic [Sesamum calycinum]|uniref:phosphoglycolate phosphatase n=1 Tax=Sesamum calycinum TaxID=2727403 RepID=A0AAW2RQY1_9LAMI
MLTTKLSAAVAVSSSSSTLFLNPHNRFNFSKRIPSVANPSLCNSLRPIVEWSFSKRKMDASASLRAVSPRASAEQLKDPDQLIDSVETFIFDCDGVIWKGDKLIDGVPETLDLLRSKEEIFASSFAAAAYLKSIDFPKDKKVYVVGEEGILKELELAGIQYLGGPEDGEKKIELKPGFMMEHDENVGAVVVGFDRYFNYYKIQYATLCIRENPGCLFIATNRDAVTHLTDAQEWAGGGSMVGAVRGSTQREPLVVGKPSTFMMDYLANKFGISKSQICMVGDRLDTDILFGQNGGCKTLLVLSGVTSLSMLQNPDNTIQPDFYTNKISDFLSLKTAAV